jgi:hypothetical protein
MSIRFGRAARDRLAPRRILQPAVLDTSREQRLIALVEEVIKIPCRDMKVSRNSSWRERSRDKPSLAVPARQRPSFWKSARHLQMFQQPDATRAPWMCATLNCKSFATNDVDGEPRRNRTFNPQIKSSRGECPPSIAGSVSLGRLRLRCPPKRANSAVLRQYSNRVVSGNLGDRVWVVSAADRIPRATREVVEES